MNFSQFLYSTIQVGIGVVIGWLLSLIGQLKMQKRQHYFELEKLKIERSEPYKERLYNLKLEIYSYIWTKFMECWEQFVDKQWYFKDENTKALSFALRHFRFEFNKKSITLQKSVFETILDILTKFDSIIRNHAILCSDEKNSEFRKYMREDIKEIIDLIDKLEKEIRKDLKLPEIEKSLAEIFLQKNLKIQKHQKRTQSTKS